MEYIPFGMEDRQLVAIFHNDKHFDSIYFACKFDMTLLLNKIL